jgi:sarcosine oxidase
MSSASNADVIVIGLGGMGSSTAAHLAQRGASVIGFDAFEPGHANGSSHGESRIIRKAYFESPDYVPMLNRAYELWEELQHESGQNLLTINGGLNIGSVDSGFVAGSTRSAREFGLNVEELDAAEVNARFPGFQLPDSLVALYDPSAGFLRPEACVAAHLDRAKLHGARLHFNSPVIEWGSNGDGVFVRTSTDRYSAGRLVITAGPWSKSLISGWDAPLEVWRIVNVHFDSTRADLFAQEHCPIFLMEVPEGHYYGFPALPGQGVKIGRHDIGVVCTPETIDREVRSDEVAMLRDVLDKYMPGASGPVKWSLTCMYSNTPDFHFVLDHHPAFSNVMIGCGFSGHGFKFASVIGEVLSELALDGSSRLDIGFLSAERFVLA